ncbi:LacI family transcriptional regulator [Spirochaetia bacterium]|nr:LacI family transcriptional regulator [Spirochaetia bacterium]
MSVSPRIVDIAKAADVSPSTVSLALNNKIGVSSALRQKIVDIAVKMGYQNNSEQYYIDENVSIRFLQIAKHGHIVNDRHNPFITEYLKSIETEAKKRKYKLEISFFNMMPVEEIVAAQKETKVKGFIVLGTELNAHELEFFLELKTPIVFIDTYFPFSIYDCIDMDNLDSVFKAVQHFYQCGHREIGLIKSSYDTRNFKMREFGFREAMEYFFLPVQEKYIISVDPTLEGSSRDIDKYLRKSPGLPTAFFCMSDIMAYSCIKTLRSYNLSVPDDVSIIGFDDLPASSLYEPPLTSVRVSTRDIGQRAMEKLSRQIALPSKYRPENILIPGNLVVRGSVRVI